MVGRGTRVRPPAPAPIRAGLAAWVVLIFTTSCAPDLDWRLVRPQGSGVELMLPCRPSTFARSIRLAGASVTWTLWSCRAGNATWAVGYAELAEPRAVPDALRELRLHTAASPDLLAATRLPWGAAGFTPQGEAGRWRWTGRLADGRQVHGETLNVALGSKVYQASVVSSRPDLESAEFFAASMQPATR